MKTQEFKELVWEFARAHTRDMPWRANTDPYYVLVSEIMLQQTQVERVVAKFELFIRRYPDLPSLADAPLAGVLTLWGGLGYNRRAKFLRDAAHKIMTDFGGTFPQTKAELVTLPGVGPNTAGAVLAYAFNHPEPFIETNIRSVFFEHFFKNQDQVSDKEILLKVALTLDQEHPRQWYWALMDYGAYLKKNGAGRLAQSRHYSKQSPLKGSLREMRGRIIKALSQTPLNEKDLKAAVIADKRFKPAVQALLGEQLIKHHQDTYSLG
jgi:A/G-specific adenine glycosylase